MEDKYIAAMLLHALGDTIGYKNSQWEFGYTGNSSLEKLYDFIELGGINYVPGKDWRVSDDTVLHIKTAEALLTKHNTINEFGNILAKKLLEGYHQFKLEEPEYRMPGLSFLTSMKMMEKQGLKWDEIPYDKYKGGSGSSMRSICIGLMFPGQNGFDKCVQYAIESGRITNNSAVGYIGGAVIALMTSMAVEGVDVLKWGKIINAQFKPDIFLPYIKKSGRGIKEHQTDIHVFKDKWKRYLEDKFDDDGNIVKRRISKNVHYRTQYYYDNYGFKGKEFFPGSGGDDSVIIAYDCLLDCEGKWEKLVVYSMLHGGDTDTTGCIAAGLYALVYGYGDMPKGALDHLEYKKELIQLGKDLYKNRI